MAIIETLPTTVKVDLDQDMATVLSNPELPLATLLKDGTAQAHEAAENSAGAKLLVSGNLDKMEYVRFLMMLWHVYDALEAALDAHASDPILAPTYNPPVLARTQRIASDLAVLLDVPEFSVENHPLHQRLLSTAPEALHNYVDRIEQLSAEGDAGRLLAHAYVRYLGDLSGGQVIRRRVAKAYNLSLEDGLGTRFYEFNKLDGSEPANAAESRDIKRWYRDGMNKGVGDDHNIKAAIVEEANHVFELNGALLATLDFDSTSATSPTSPTTPLSPLSPTAASPSSPTSPSKPLMQSKVIYDASKDGDPALSSGEWSFSANTVIPIIIAFGAAHFMMVVGGFLGSKGDDKWKFFNEYLRSLFGISF